MIPNEFDWSDDEIAELAAEFCWQSVSDNDKRVLAARWLIEYLSLDHSAKMYTKEGLKKMILKEVTQKQWKQS